MGWGTGGGGDGGGGGGVWYGVGTFCTASKIFSRATWWRFCPDAGGDLRIEAWGGRRGGGSEFVRRKRQKVRGG